MVKKKTRLNNEGAWCSGITSDLHSEGPGFNPRRVHFSTVFHQDFKEQCLNDVPETSFGTFLKNCLV
jgi:hypothetical protein